MASRSTDTVAVKRDFAAMIAEVAYFKAERRGFVPGHELDDWFEAEREVAEATAPPARPKAASGRKKTATR